MQLPKELIDMLKRTQATGYFEPLSQKMTIRHKGLTEEEKKILGIWYEKNFPYQLVFEEVAE